MIGRLLHKSEFERVLAVPPCSRSAHFVLHHLHARPGESRALDSQELCTADAPLRDIPVDKAVTTHWIGCIVPKRHARRAVTRNVLRRLARAAMQRHVARLRPGLWLIRLRQPFARSAGFVSADSPALRVAASAELDQLFTRVAT